MPGYYGKNMAEKANEAANLGIECRAYDRRMQRIIGGAKYMVDTLEDELQRMAGYVSYLERYSAPIIRESGGMIEPRSDENVMALRRSYGVQEVIERMGKERGQSG